ncbi:hypothetical protein Ciccas_012525, partial [Cichlidogyrus casuarinus]
MDIVSDDQQSDETEKSPLSHPVQSSLSTSSESLQNRLKRSVSISSERLKNLHSVSMRSYRKLSSPTSSLASLEEPMPLNTEIVAQYAQLSNAIPSDRSSEM